MFQESVHAKAFQNYLEKADFPHTPQHLYDPIRYILSLSGKQIRPLFVMMGAELYDYSVVEQALPVCVVIEYFHNFTLIQDDKMDVAHLRRGKPTVHQKWNDNVAILS